MHAAPSLPPPQPTPHLVHATGRRRMPEGLTGPQALIALVGAWVATVGNLPLWHSALTLGSPTAALTLAALVWLAWCAVMQALAWPGVLKPAMTLALVLCAVNTHFMHTYGVVIDPTMVANALATDVHEARDLLSLALALTLAAVAGPGLWLLWRWPRTRRLGWRGVWHRLAWAVAALLALVGVLWLGYADLASLMRNHTTVRYQINPFNAAYGLVRTASREPPGQVHPLAPVGRDATVARPSHHKPPLVLLVVGETARAASFGLSGAGRDTTPRLRRWLTQERLVYWRQASACGTNTRISVPCMFSPLTASEGGNEPAHHENLLDVLQHAGLAVLWVDNQSGCKGVCDRVPQAHTTDRADPRWCADGPCDDEILLQGLDARLAALPPERRAHGTVIVLHMMGSHGPAYFKRSPPDRKPFQPECRDVTLAQCAPQALHNAYDNSIAYTDHVLDQALHWLRARERTGRYATGLVYASDHGESLGESGLYLHGTPRALAPSEQTHIPMLAWYSPTLAQQLRLDLDCLRGRADGPISHDHLFHSLLGLLDVQTLAHRRDLDWHTGCRRA